VKAKYERTNTQAPRSLLHTKSLNFFACFIGKSSEKKLSLSGRIDRNVVIRLLREVLALARGIIIILFVI